jgi:chemotaxis response regulator CheB
MLLRAKGLKRLQARILIVDDEPLARDRIREMLKGDPEIQCVSEARNGREAVEVVNELAPDIVFLDVQMPDMDGFAVLKELDAPCPSLFSSRPTTGMHYVRSMSTPSTT